MDAPYEQYPLGPITITHRAGKEDTVTFPDGRTVPMMEYVRFLAARLKAKKSKKQQEDQR
jgi:hypothetical protein